MVNGVICIDNVKQYQSASEHLKLNLKPKPNLESKSDLQPEPDVTFPVNINIASI